MRRILQTLDMSEAFAPHLAVLTTQFLIGLICSGAAIGTRELIDLVMPGAGPFGLTMPFVLFATLFARWQAGTVALVLLLAHAWYFVLPAKGSFLFENPADAPRVFVNVLAGSAIVILGEYFRRIVQTTLAERDRISADRLLLLQELDHRVKNNFSIVSAMMRIEIRKSHSEELIDTLQRIAGRIDSIARAHGALYRDEAAAGAVDMRTYIGTLCQSLAEAFFADRNIKLVTAVDDISLPRDTAISIGLVVNELCTNAAKHAFTGLSLGMVRVEVKRTEDGILFAVEDDGLGLAQARTSDSRVGGILLEAFASQAGGELTHVPTPRGTRFEMVLHEV